jgi:hypothetical protein
LFCFQRTQKSYKLLSFIHVSVINYLVKPSREVRELQRQAPRLRALNAFLASPTFSHTRFLSFGEGQPTPLRTDRERGEIRCK